MISLSTITAIAENRADVPALVAGKSYMTWNGLKCSTEERTGYLLERFKGSPPKRGCYLAQNCMELVPWLAACATLGIPVTGLDYTAPAGVTRQLIGELGADLFFHAAQQGSESLIEDEAALTVIDVRMPVSPTSGAHVPERVADEWQPPENADAISLTSGTSGPPKRVLRSRSFDRRRFDYFTARFGFTADDAFLLSMPLYHAAGNGWARMFLGLGAALHFVPIDSPAEIARAIAQQGIRATVMHPHLLGLVLDVLDEEGYDDAPDLRWLLVGGKHFPPSLKIRANRRLGKVVHEYYGTTETGVNALSEPDEMLQFPTSVGRPIDGNRIRIVDRDGAVLPSRLIGTVAVASYMNMDDYADGNAEALVLDGERYLCTADQGYLGDDGRLYLLNRAGAAEEFSPVYRLEDAIRDCEGVSDVALVQCDPGAGIDCIVAPAPGVTVDEKLMRTIEHMFVGEQVSLGGVHVVDKIPYSPSGKVRISDLGAVAGIEKVA